MGIFMYGGWYFNRKVSAYDTCPIGRTEYCRNIHTYCNSDLGYDLSYDDESRLPKHKTGRKKPERTVGNMGSKLVDKTIYHVWNRLCISIRCI